jgi:hypothetical protein
MMTFWLLIKMEVVKMLKRFLCLLSLCFVLLMTACAAGMGGYDYYNGEAALDENGEAYI